MVNDVTSITGTAIFLFLILAVMMLALPRRWAVAPLIITIVLMTIGQQVVVAGAHFSTIRLMILVGWIRIIARGEISDLEKNAIDDVFLVYVAASVIIGLIPKPLHPNSVIVHNLSTEFMSKAGFAFDALGAYFLCRCFVKNMEDVTYAIRFLVGVSVVLACFMTLEMATGRNVFSVFGIVPEFTGIRDGRLRCQGPFSHPIHAGSFGATLVPLCVGLWFYGMKNFAVVGVIAGSLIVYESSSSGPLMAYVCGILALLFWRFRENMREVRWGLVTLLVALELFMKAHVWWAIAHVADFVGGGGYWRAKLIDQFVMHFREWWLIGTNYTAHWSPTGSGLPEYPDMMDLTNKFVAEGVGGGLLVLILFIAIIVMCYTRVGNIVRNTQNYPLEERFLFWTMGCSIFSYIFVFMSVSSSAQTGVLYYILLAFISCKSKEGLYPVSESSHKIEAWYNNSGAPV